MKPYIIAEIGVNHNGNLNLAKEMISAASECGADCVKFQAYSVKNTESRDTIKPAYFKNDKKIKSKIKYLNNVALNSDQFLELKNFSKKKKINFLVTACDIETIPWLEKKINLESYKVGSSDTNNYQLLKRILKTKKPIYLSTGMCDLDMVKKSVDYILNNGCKKLTVMQCTSSYPASYDILNVGVISLYKTLFGDKCKIGYSDHSKNELSAIVALGAGAVVFEKHFTLDHNLPGVDQIASSDPKEFKHYVNSIKKAALSYGTGLKKINPKEKKNLPAMRKTFYMRKNVAAGNKITDAAIIALRPNLGGIESHKYNEILGKKLKYSKNIGEKLKLKDLIIK